MRMYTCLPSIKSDCKDICSPSTRMCTRCVQLKCSCLRASSSTRRGKCVQPSFDAVLKDDSNVVFHVEAMSLQCSNMAGLVMVAACTTHKSRGGSCLLTAKHSLQQHKYIHISCTIEKDYSKKKRRTFAIRLLLQESGSKVSTQAQIKIISNAPRLQTGLLLTCPWWIVLCQVWSRMVAWSIYNPTGNWTCLKGKKGGGGSQSESQVFVNILINEWNEDYSFELIKT